MEHIEYEERVLISKDDYQRIIEYVKGLNKPYVSLSIENIYLDNDEEYIQKSKQMFRIRKINGKISELTLKVKNPDGSCNEINETLEEHPLINKQLGNLSKYKEIANLYTDRIEVQEKDHLLVIDQNIYHGVKDYDLEVEASSQEKAKEIILQYCEKFGLTYRDDYHSKSYRAILQSKKK